MNTIVNMLQTAAFEFFSTISLDSLGAPQLGQVSARTEIFLPQDVHFSNFRFFKFTLFGASSKPSSCLQLPVYFSTGFGFFFFFTFF